MLLPQGPPEYARPRGSDGYTVEAGRIVSTDGLDIPVEDYPAHFQERQISYAMAKQTRVAGRGGPMVGALARMNVKFDRLSPAAAGLAREVGFAVPDHSPFHNNLAQALEIVHGIDECVESLDGLEPVDERPEVTPAAGEGAAITEAPRGLLYHAYAVNRKGVMERANLVTPTAHNFLSIEEDLQHLVDALADQPPERIRLACEMLVRAYDPCFSCSVH
ncbi:MAG TPA: nickel-dependent hydrogenase large subunit [Phycisphaerae bacterium]|nr:nickel-dependent hydrogenase large subunit [Phycisphaerae bacterium]